MAWRDFAAIYHVAEPSATIEEQVAVVPQAFAYAREHPGDTSEFLDSLIYFVCERGSPAADPRDAIRDCFRAWTATFDDDRVEACYVLLNELCRFLLFIPLAEELFASIVETDRRYAAELSRRLVEANGFWEHTPAMRPASRSKRIIELANREYDRRTS